MPHTCNPGGGGQGDPFRNEVGLANFSAEPRYLPDEFMSGLLQDMKAFQEKIGLL